MTSKTMKVLHLVAGELSDGAARGAYWLHLGLRRLGIDSTLLTNGCSEDADPSVIAIAATPIQRRRLAVKARVGNFPILLYRKRNSVFFSTGLTGYDFTRHPSYREAELIHLHWINGLVSIRTLRKINKPLIWTLRDMWPLTGGCHVALDCERYRQGCGLCPQLGSTLKLDLTRLIVANKRASFPKHMKLVGMSQWMTDCARQSEIFRGSTCTTIGNNVDTGQFFHLEQGFARQALALPLGKKIVLAGAFQLDEIHKGFDLFVEALKQIPAHDRLHVVLFGKVSEEALSHIGIEHTYLGFLHDLAALRLTYSAADVFVAPSRMDAFGKTLVEAMSCGTPVVCFDATGPKDIVSHRLTGYKASPFDPRDLASGIQWVLDLSPAAAAMLSRQARERTISCFDSEVIAQQYLELYQLTIAERSSGIG
jgi:glycosyltransferase involved in cell wall biosynthesis